MQPVLCCVCVNNAYLVLYPAVYAPWQGVSSDLIQILCHRGVSVKHAVIASRMQLLDKFKDNDLLVS